MTPKERSLSRFILAAILCALAPAQAAPPAPLQGGRIIATDYPSLQDAINAAKAHEGSEVYLPAGAYTLTKTLDLTLPTGYGGYLKITGAGMNSRIIARTHGQPAIDTTGASSLEMSSLMIDAEDVKPGEAPNIGILLARRSDGGSSQENHFTNVSVIGHFTLANVYNATGELDRFIGCVFINKEPGAHNVMWVSENAAKVASPYRGAIRSLYSNTESRFEQCSFNNWGGGQGGSNIYLTGFTMDLTVRDSYMNPPAGGYAVYMGMSKGGGPMSNALFEGIRIEGDNAAGIFKIQKNGRAEDITIRNCAVFYSHGLAFDARNASISELHLSDNILWNIGGWKTAMEFGAITNSTLYATDARWDNYGDAKNAQPGPPVVIRADRAQGCVFRVQRRADLVIPKITASVIDAMDDDGAARRYLGSAASGTILNMRPTNTALLKGSKRGDIALDDGANTLSHKPGLAVFDGARWVYMN